VGAAVLILAAPGAVRDQPAAVAAASPPTQAAPEPSLDPWSGRWSVSEVTRDGERILVRRNATAAVFAGGRRFRERVSITVPLPRGADYTPATDINRVETLLVDALERDRTAICVLVLTTDAAREFVFYAADAARAAGVVPGVREQAAPYDLLVQTAPDPSWERYASFAP
jgi:hypothetical protein